MAVKHRWPLRHDQRLQLLVYGSLRHCIEVTGAERKIGRGKVKGRVFLSGRAVMRMGIDVWAPSPSHGRRRLEGGLVFLVGHCVDVVVWCAAWGKERVAGTQRRQQQQYRTVTLGLGRQWEQTMQRAI